MTVWRQAKNYGIPAIFFMNKMDKQNADFPGSVASISKKLGLQPLVMQVFDYILILHMSKAYYQHNLKQAT